MWNATQTELDVETAVKEEAPLDKEKVERMAAEMLRASGSADIKILLHQEFGLTTRDYDGIAEGVHECLVDSKPALEEIAHEGSLAEAWGAAQAVTNLILNGLEADIRAANSRKIAAELSAAIQCALMDNLAQPPLETEESIQQAVRGWVRTSRAATDKRALPPTMTHPQLAEQLIREIADRV